MIGYGLPLPTQVVVTPYVSPIHLWLWVVTQRYRYNDYLPLPTLVVLTPYVSPIHQWVVTQRYRYND